ncbi:MAG: DUF11 domain-containing protein [Myxococcales bacterium]|nr:DUF11 domain-containing protein [Myxococcales bacterium]
MRRLSLAIAALSSFVLTSAEAQELRFTATDAGNIVSTGNTLGLAKELNLNGPGIRDSIGTFLTLGGGSDNTPANPLNPWPAGTTNDWTQNGSAAELSLPVESTVLYAELLWGGSYQYVEDVTPFLNDDVTLTAGANSITVSPDPATAVTESGTANTGFAIRYYMRSADVTSFVANALSGTYSVSGVPATQTTSINSLNAAGWTLVVAYRDQAQSTKNLSVFVGGSFVDEDSQVDYGVSGFCAPPAGVVEGTAVVSAIEGDANLTGDQFLIAPSVAGPFVNLSAPNNPANNFFCSQLNDADGQLDTSGTFGNVNHDAAAGVNVSGARQGWDVTTLPLSSNVGQLQNGQTSAVLRTITTGDSYMPILAAFAIDVNSPDFSGAGTGVSATPTTVTVGDTFTVTSTLDNDGEVTAQDVTFQLQLPAGVSLVSFETDGSPGDINGNAVTGATLASGVDEGDLAPNATRTVTLELSVDSEPLGTTIPGSPIWSYAFEVCQNGPLYDQTFSQLFTVAYEAPTTSTTSTTTGSGGAPGTGGAGGSSTIDGGSTGVFGDGGESQGGASSQGGNGGSGGGAVLEADGCGCHTAPVRSHWGVALLALALAFARRRAQRG